MLIGSKMNEMNKNTGENIHHYLEVKVFAAMFSFYGLITKPIKTKFNIKRIG